MFASTRAGAEGWIGADAATVLYDLGSAASGNLVPLGIAVLIGTSGLANRRASLFPRWFAWVSLGLALLLVTTPLGWVFLLLGVLWVVLAGVLLRGGSYVRGTGRPRTSNQG